MKRKEQKKYESPKEKCPKCERKDKCPFYKMQQIMKKAYNIE